jgi:transcriptional regulator with PAS, ATPase and Fis domain
MSYKLLNVTFDSVSEGMIVLDDKLNIKRVNNKAINILGITPEEALKINIGEILRNVDVYTIMNLSDKTYTNVECNFYIKSDIVKCIANIIPMNANNKLIGVVITFREMQYVHKLVNKVVGYKASYKFDDFITVNNRMKEIIGFAERAAKSDCNILIEGESGTGKEVIAQSIHNCSKRSDGPFVAVNCASIPRELVESELFGYDKGAFTGANKEGHPGKFELADGGTIFLDEVGELPLDIQTKLLRVLDNNKIVRVGGYYEKQLNVRDIGATNRVLKEEIKKKNFREDLYYRLNVMNIKTIPLRERKEDIEALVNKFVGRLNAASNGEHKFISSDYIEHLKQYDWHGNVRELRNIVERDYYLSKDHITSAKYMEQDLEEYEADTNEGTVKPLHVMEKENIERAMESCKGNTAAAARILNIGRATLYRKIKNIIYMFRINDSTSLDPKYLCEIIFLDLLIAQHPM